MNVDTCSFCDTKTHPDSLTRCHNGHGEEKYLCAPCIHTYRMTRFAMQGALTDLFIDILDVIKRMKESVNK